MSRQEKGPLLLLYERFHVILLVTAAAVVAAYLLASSAEPMYRGQVRCFLPTTPDILSLSTEQGNIPTQPKLPVASTETQDSLLGVIRSAELRLNVANAVPERNTEHLAKHTKFEIDKYNLLVITAWDQDPALAAQIANTYMLEFQAFLRAVNQKEVAESATTLQAAIQATTEELRAAEQERLAFLQANNSVDYGTEFQSLAARIERIRSAISDLDTRIGTLDDEEAAIRRQMAARESLLVDREFLLSSRAEVRNPRVDALQAAIADKELQRLGLMLLFRDPHPAMVRIRTELEELRRQLAEESSSPFVAGSRSYTLDQLRTSLENRLYQLGIDRDALAAERAVRQQQLDEALSEWRAMPEFKTTLDMLDQRVAHIRQTLSLEMQRREEFRLFQARTPNYVLVTEQAVAASEPSYPDVPVTVAVAAVLGLVVSVVLVVVLDRVQYWREQAPW